MDDQKEILDEIVSEKTYSKPSSLAIALEFIPLLAGGLEYEYQNFHSLFISNYFFLSL
jgi:hypothetical protein